MVGTRCRFIKLSRYSVLGTRYLTQQPIGVRPWIEGLKVLGLFPDAEEANGKVELAPQGHDRAAAGGSIQLGHDDAGRLDGFLKECAPLHRVLSHRGIEDEEGLVWGARATAGDHPDHLAELIHQSLLGVESSRRIDEESVAASPIACLHRGCRH